MSKNYFVYLIKQDYLEKGLKAGQALVGETRLMPGISDEPYGVIYVVSSEAITDIFFDISDLKKKVLAFYGINW